MRQRWIAFFAALVIVSTACGTDDDEESADAVASGPTPVTAAPLASTMPAVTEAPAETEAPAATMASAETEAPATTAAADAAPVEPPATVVPATNPATNPAVDALSTFAMDVDTGSYTYARASLRNGVVPDPEAVRTEEFVNFHAQDYAAPEDATFAIVLDGATAPFLPADTRVIRVGIQGREISDAMRPDANLTFVVDVSGSMADAGKLDAVRPALQSLATALRPTDRVAIVVYSEDPRLLLPSTPVSEWSTIESAILGLQPGSGTNVEQGLRLGYEQAATTFAPERINRVVLLSDGVANVGATGPEAILEVIGDAARDGIDLVTVGFGLGDYNDVLMEQLADQGDGFYAYVDGEAEARRLFTEDLSGTLQTIAREAKVQVEFNPDAVTSYRLIGFENRAVDDGDFRDDAVDGGEVGAGHTVTALYEVTVHEGASADAAWLARAVIRWLDPETSAPGELDATLFAADLAESLGDSSLRLQQDVYIAAFAETLRGSGWSGLMSLEGLSHNLHSLASRLGDEDLAEAADLVDARIRLG